MIYFLVTERGSHTLRDYLQVWAGDLKKILTVMTYESFRRWPPDAFGTFIFTDLERLTDEQVSIFTDYADHLEYSFPEVMILNHPKYALRRLDLLNALHKAGINNFNAYPLARIPGNIRYPIFLRIAREHNGPCSKLLQDQKALLSECCYTAIAGLRLEELLAVEYLDTRSPDGWFRKYSAFRFGDRIVPAHMIFSKDWVAKDNNGLEDSLREEQKIYMSNNPHAAVIRHIFDLAKIQYGRIDYSMLEQKPQVWEINTNPILLKRREEYDSGALAIKEGLSLTIQERLKQLDTPHDPNRHSKMRAIRLNNFFSFLPWAQ